MKTTRQAEIEMEKCGIQGEIAGRQNSTSWQVEFANEIDMWNFRMKIALIGGIKTGQGTWMLATCYKASDLRDRASFFQRDFVTAL